MDLVKTQATDQYLAEGERRVTPLAVCHGRLEVDDRLSRGRHVKIAAAEDAVKEASKITPVPGRAYALVVGLGSEPYWGVNNNGDSFPEEALLGLPPKGVPMGFFDKFARRIPKAWGYTTFKKAHVFQEHMNSSPRYAIGGMHDSFWNPRMHRVENLCWVDRTNPRGVKWARRIDAGDPTVGTSMACHVPFDRCSICNNLAPTRAQYCGHLRPGSPDYALRQIREDGKPVSMINDYPDFFDESFVEVPAAPEAVMIAKVASGKAATMTKLEPDLPSDVAMDDLAGLYQAEHPLPEAVMGKLAALGLPAAVAGAQALGICFRPSELYRLAFGAGMLDAKTAADLDAKALACAPDPLEGAALEKLASGMSGSREKASALATAMATDLLAPFAYRRSYAEPYLTTRLMKSAAVRHQPAALDTREALLLRGYHGLYKLASGFCGYGERQAKLAYLSAAGIY